MYLWVIEVGEGTTWKHWSGWVYTSLAKAKTGLRQVREYFSYPCFRITKYVPCEPSIHKGAKRAKDPNK